MDFFTENDTIDTEIHATPNIECQLDKYNVNEYFTHKQIPEKALFIPLIFANKIKQFYKSNIDIPLLIYGVKGCGKVTAVLGLINNYVSKMITSDNIQRINNIYYMKILDKEYNKLLAYENLYYLNIDILANAGEILSYIKYLYKLSKGRSIDGVKKLIIISHIDKCNTETQKYINYILDKLTVNVSYIFTITNLNNITKKINTYCAKLHFGYLNTDEFRKVFLYNYNHIFEKKYCDNEYMTQYYQIYINNHYNIGNTISQIKYLIYTNNLSMEHITLNSNTSTKSNQSLMYTIVNSFIKHYIKLSTINNALDIRKYLYTLLTLNIDLLDFIKMLIKQIICSDTLINNKKINNEIKAIIISKASDLSHQLPKNNKEVINVETFLYNIIYIIFSNIQK